MGSQELMKKILDEITFDIGYIRGHTLQPQWFKILKVFILFGVLYGYSALFGLKATIIFFAVFLLMGLIVHFTYRNKTKRYTVSWLDFVVVEENGELKTQRIGKYYYSAVMFNVIISVVVSLVLS